MVNNSEPIKVNDQQREASNLKILGQGRRIPVRTPEDLGVKTSNL